MTKKELEEKLKNIPKDKYIYQRHNGIITKYIDKENHYISCETGNAYEKYDNMFLGKMAEDITDLIEENDIVSLLINGKEILNCFVDKIDIKTKFKVISNDIKILSILTKEQYEANCYKVKEK